MDKQELKKLLCEMGLENSLMFESPDYMSAIVGIDYHSGSIIYDYDLMVQHLMKQDNISEQDAIDFVEFNTLRSIPYVTGGVPPTVLTKLHIFD